MFFCGTQQPRDTIGREPLLAELHGQFRAGRSIHGTWREKKSTIAGFDGMFLRHSATTGHTTTGRDPHYWRGYTGCFAQDPATMWGATAVIWYSKPMFMKQSERVLYPAYSARPRRWHPSSPQQDGEKDDGDGDAASYVQICTEQRSSRREQPEHLSSATRKSAKDASTFEYMSGLYFCFSRMRVTGPGSRGFSTMFFVFFIYSHGNILELPWFFLVHSWKYFFTYMKEFYTLMEV